MGDAIGQLLPFAFGVAVSPMPIIAMVLMLITPRARVNASVFLLGWILGVAVTGAIVLVIAGAADPSDQGAPADWVNVMELVLGVLLLRAAVREWRARPAAGTEPPMPKWMGMLGSITPAKAGGLAVVLSAVNPKNLLLIVGGATAVAQTDISGGEQAIAWLVFTLIATIGVAAPMVVYLFMGDRAGHVLDELESSMARHNSVVMAALCLILGVKLIGDAISGFSA
jgi:hypothetical protein